MTGRNSTAASRFMKSGSANWGICVVSAMSKTIIARQQLTPLFHRNGIAYAITRDCLLGQKTIMGARTGALPIDGPTISIDTEWDIDLCEFLMRRNGYPESEG